MRLWTFGGSRFLRPVVDQHNSDQWERARQARYQTRVYSSSFEVKTLPRLELKLEAQTPGDGVN